MTTATAGPFRVLPARARAAFEVLQYCRAVECGSGDPVFQRDLDVEERRTKRTALHLLNQYLMAENDYADMIYIGVPVAQQQIEVMLNGGPQVEAVSNDGGVPLTWHDEGDEEGVLI